MAAEGRRVVGYDRRQEFSTTRVSGWIQNSGDLSDDPTCSRRWY